jgi:hypothetical protein
VHARVQVRARASAQPPVRALASVLVQVQARQQQVQARQQQVLAQVPAQLAQVLLLHLTLRRRQ